jgi:adenosine deaminase
MSDRPTLQTLTRAPKVLLHDHLDGGLRPQTVIELAADAGYRELPTTDAGELSGWFTRSEARSSLDLYLGRFQHTVAVMQTEEALQRVAAECAEDLAADGVVYAEVRFAPELHLEAGLSLDQVVEAVMAGMAQGAAGRTISIGVLLTAMRHAARSTEIAELALRHRDQGHRDQGHRDQGHRAQGYRDQGVVGFDIAGSEAGFPPTRHLDAFRLIAQGNFHITIHAGEAFGLPSIWEAVQHCGAERLGHGVRIVDDITLRPDGQPELGRLAAFIRDRRVALELCPTSNVDTGAAPSIAEHPIDLLKRLRFRVTVNTDNRLMSDISLSREFAGLVDTFGYGWDDVEWMTINAMKSAFWPFEERLKIINGIIKPGFAALKWDASTAAPVPV